MSYEATQRPPGRGASLAAAVRVRIAALRASEAWRAASRAFLWSRLAIFLIAVYAALAAGSGGLSERNAERFDVPALTHPLGGFGDTALAPLARWDAVWYLTVAADGYDDADSPRQAFFPLYPLLVRGLSEVGGGGAGALLLAAYALALFAFLGALVLLWRLAALEAGRSVAGATVLLMCTFPASLYFGAPYSESLFLLCSVGAFYAARTGNWAWAGIAAGAASATRSAGILLLAPLLVLYLYGPREDAAAAPSSWRPRFAIRPDFAWLLLAPAGLAAYALYLGLAHGDALAFSHVQGFWNRDFAGPLVGAWDGATAAFDGARQLLSGARDPVYFEQAAGDPFRIAAINLMLFGALVFAVWGAVGVLRRLPFAYGLYVVAALMLPLSYPVGPQPLMSLPRFTVVLFPIFIWLAIVCEERRVTAHAAAVSALGLGLFVTEFASWHWIA